MSDFELSKIPSGKIDQLPESLHPNLFTSAAWLGLLVDQYDFDFYVIKQSETQNFLPAAKISHFGFSKVTVLPFCDYIVPSAQDAPALANIIREIQKQFPDIPIEFKITLPAAINAKLLPFPLHHTAYCHTVDTAKNLDEVESAMDNSFMRGVRKAQSHDLNISMRSDVEALDRFYEIYCRQRISKFGKLPQPYSFFEKLRDRFFGSDNGFILQVEKDSTVIASMVILSHHNTLYYKFGCSLQEYLNHRPNNLLFYELFKYACNNNFSKVDLGLSGVSDSYKGLRRFKEYMGGVPENIYSLRIEPDAYDDTAEQQLNEFTSRLTQTIVEQQPNYEQADAFSETLYPYFA